MAGFLDGCKQSSNILAPLLDLLIADSMREEEADFILRSLYNGTVCRFAPRILISIIALCKQ